MSVVKLENVSVLEAVSVVVETPVAPVIAPAAEILIDGVEKNLLKPVAEAKLMPLIILELLFDPAVKLIPLMTLVLFVFVALLNESESPLVVIEETEVLLLVKLRA